MAVPARARLRPAAARWVGLVGTLLLAIGGYGAGARPYDSPIGILPDRAMLAERPGYTAALVAWLVGTALLVVAWYQLRQPARDDQLSSRWMLLTAALWAIPLALAPPLASRDIYAYAAQGDLYAHGLNPYQVGPAALPSHWLEHMSPAWQDSPAPYGPLFLLIARGVATVTGNLVGAVGLLRAAALLGVLLTAAFLPRLARAAGVPAGTALWFGLASPVVLLHGVSGAHNDALMVGLLVAGLAAAAERRAVPAGIALGLAVAVKATAMVALPFAVLLAAASVTATSVTAASLAAASVAPPDQRRWYPILRAGLLVGTAAVASFGLVTVASGLGVGWVGALSTAGTSVQWLSIPTGVGMAIGYVLGLPHLPGNGGGAIAAARGAAFYGLLPILLVWLWWRVRSCPGTPAGTRRIVAHAGWALAALVLLSPVIHPWYVLWPLTVLAASALVGSAERVLVWIPVGLAFLVLPDGYNLARATTVPGVLFDLVVTAALVALVVRRWQAHRAGPPAVPSTVDS